MNTDVLVLKFSNLLEVANLSTSSGKGYEKQRILMDLFRQRKVPFLATMPMRHQYYCEKCNRTGNDSIHYFENPAVMNSKNQKHGIWGNPSGIWAEVKTRELHGVLAHDESLNEEFKIILESVQ